jgi:hypothetical protein
MDAPYLLPAPVRPDPEHRTPARRPGRFQLAAPSEATFDSVTGAGHRTAQITPAMLLALLGADDNGHLVPATSVLRDRLCDLGLTEGAHVFDQVDADGYAIPITLDDGRYVYRVMEAGRTVTCLYPNPEDWAPRVPHHTVTYLQEPNAVYRGWDSLVVWTCTCGASDLCPTAAEATAEAAMHRADAPGVVAEVLQLHASAPAT